MTIDPTAPSGTVSNDSRSSVQIAHVDSQWQQTDFDVVVIGGGVNGTGVLRDCAMRGIKACLFERNDLAFGASGNSSGMIHGGVKYLTSNPGVTRLSCLDSGYIQQIAPHLLFRIPFLMTVNKALGARVWLQLVDAFFGVYDKYQPLKRGLARTRLTADEVRQIEPGIGGDILGAISFDEWGIDGARLCVANAVDAYERGAKVFTHTSVESIECGECIEHDDGTARNRIAAGSTSGDVASNDLTYRTNARGVRTIHWRDMLTGKSGRVTARLVVNATGAWAPLTAASAKIPAKSARIRPGKGIHVVFDRRLSNYAIVAQSIDDRQIFVEPWQNVTLLGTTDTDFYGDLDRTAATSDEVRYLVEGISRVFPAIKHARAIDTLAGVRPTLYDYGPVPDKLSREHQIIDHAHHGVDGMYSMIGGKLASYRIFAKEMTDILAQRLHVVAPCATHLSPLPGGEKTVEDLDHANLDPIATRRVVYRHGTRAIRIADELARNQKPPRMLCVCESVTFEEASYVIEHEFVRTIGDLSRRLRLGRGPCAGLHCVMQACALLSERLEMLPNDALSHGLFHLQQTSRNRAVVMNPALARQEQLFLATLRGQLGLMGETR